MLYSLLFPFVGYLLRSAYAFPTDPRETKSLNRRGDDCKDVPPAQYQGCVEADNAKSCVIGYYPEWSKLGFGDLGLAQCTRLCGYKPTSDTGVGGPVTCAPKDPHNVKWDTDSSG